MSNNIDLSAKISKSSSQERELLKTKLMPLNNSHAINQNYFSCILIGWESLVIKFSELLIANGNKVLGIISQGDLVRHWAKENNIPYQNSIQSINDFIFQTNFDYLFSIYNLEIIPQDILHLPQKYAVNCHDSLLPKYAGLNAPSWAIFNKEKYHGITWHLMTEKIDEGDIIYQVSFEVSEDETALSLNTKCYESVVKSFSHLIKLLTTNNIIFQPQNLAERSIFYGYQKPTPSCIILWENTAEQIERQVRCLTYENIPNYLGIAKLYLNGKFWLIKKVEITSNHSPLNAGTILEIASNYIKISTITQDIIISDLYTIQGKSISPVEWCKISNLKEGDRIFSVDLETQKKLLSLEKILFKHEKFWVNKLVNLEPIKLFSLKNNQEYFENKEVNILKTKILDFNFIESFFSPENNLIKKEVFVLSIILIYLGRINQNHSFDVGINNNKIQSKIYELDSLFATILPLRVNWDNHDNIFSFITKIQEELDRLEKHLTFSKDICIRYPQLSQNKSFQNQYWFDVIIEMETSSNDQVISNPHDSLVFNINATETQMQCHYNPLYFDEIKINKFLENLKIFSQNLTKNLGTSLDKISLLSPEEFNLIIHQFNPLYKQDLKSNLIHKLFEEQVLKNPENIAIVSGEEKFTYQQLNEKANKLANYLIKLGVKIETLIAIYLERSLNMIVALIAILKSGSAYIPVDTKYPSDRIKFILEDADISWIISEKKLLNKLPKKDNKIILLDQDWQNIAEENQDNPYVNINLFNLAYIIYTSGSTGKPKGVMIEHKSLSYFSQSAIKAYDIKENDRILQFSSISFDAAVEEIFPCLINGSTLILRTEEMINDLKNFLQECEKLQITILNFPTAYWHIFITEIAMQNLVVYDCLRLVIIGGEKVITQKINLWEKVINNKVKLINTYGPTEATVTTTIFEISENQQFSEIPIGYPINYGKTYILDNNLQILPIGFVGELCIGGDGLARGYLNRPDLTAEKFIDNPFDSGKLYKTGDLCRYLPNGNIEFIGRKDEQVKIRGFRIELGEIENNLLQYLHIKETVVMALENETKDKYLVAYIVSNESINVKEIREYLDSKLPDYMIPSAFIFLDNFSLTPNGKIDKKALPKANFDSYRESEFVAPRNEIEMKLAHIWQEVLNIEKIGINDNFFALGGHSLLATQIVSRIRTNFMVELPLRNIFEYPTIAQLCDRISEMEIMETGEI